MIDITDGPDGSQAAYIHALPDDQRAQWHAWLNRHGINPDDLYLPGVIIREPAGRRVVYTPATPEPGDGRLIWKTKNGDLIAHYARSEYPLHEPEPFPEVTT